MRNSRRHLVLAAAILAGIPIGLLSKATAQQVYPTKPITILVPAAAGGPTDTVTRLIGESMSRTLAQQVIIENVGGAGGTIGTVRVARAAPDGYTLLVWHIAQSTAPALYDNLRYDVLNDFDSIGRITDVPMTIVGKKDLAAKNIEDLLAWVKEKKTGVTYGHAGVGSASHLCALLFMNALNTPMTAVSYRGTGPAMNDLLGGQFDMMCDQTTGTTNHIKGGSIKGYAVTTRARLSTFPELPTLAEAGIKDFEVTAWHAMWAPKGLPKDVVDKLVGALQIALKDPKVIERFASLSTEPVPLEQATPAALRAQLEAEVPKWRRVIQAAGVKGE
jgi:tripartite-type tricarboxylate transporter receptor subunit TctC